MPVGRATIPLPGQQKNFSAAMPHAKAMLAQHRETVLGGELTGYSGRNSAQQHIAWAVFTQNRNPSSKADGPRPHVCTDNGRNITRLRIPAQSTVQDGARSALQLNIKDDAVRFAIVDQMQAFVTAGRDAYLVVRLT